VVFTIGADPTSASSIVPNTHESGLTDLGSSWPLPANSTELGQIIPIGETLTYGNSSEAISSAQRTNTTESPKSHDDDDGDNKGSPASQHFVPNSMQTKRPWDSDDEDEPLLKRTKTGPSAKVVGAALAAGLICLGNTGPADRRKRRKTTERADLIENPPTVRKARFPNVETASLIAIADTNLPGAANC